MPFCNKFTRVTRKETHMQMYWIQARNDDTRSKSSYTHWLILWCSHEKHHSNQWRVSSMGSGNNNLRLMHHVIHNQMEKTSDIQITLHTSANLPKLLGVDVLSHEHTRHWNVTPGKSRITALNVCIQQILYIKSFLKRLGSFLLLVDTGKLNRTWVQVNFMYTYLRNYLIISLVNDTLAQGSFSIFWKETLYSPLEVSIQGGCACTRHIGDVAKVHIRIKEQNDTIYSSNWWNQVKKWDDGHF